MHQSDVRYDEREEETGRTEKIPVTKQELDVRTIPQ
jgi:hypothetical protein